MAAKTVTTKSPTETRRRAKLAKIGARRSAPVPTVARPTRVTESERLLQLLSRELRSARVNGDAGYNGVANASMGAAMDYAKALAHLPPETPYEVMAQACILFDEARDVALADEWPGGYAKGVSDRIVRRALGIAFWVETAFQIDRKQTGLDVFMPANRHEIVRMSASFPDYSSIDRGIRQRRDEIEAL